MGGQISEAQSEAASGCDDALGQAGLHGALLGLHPQGGHLGVARARGVLEGCSHWITCAATHVDAAIRKQPLQGLRLMLALAMTPEHLMRCDKACYQICAAVRMHGGQTLRGAFNAAGWRPQNRGFLATGTAQASLSALLLGVEWTVLCFPGTGRLGRCRVRRPTGLGCLSWCPKAAQPFQRNFFLPISHTHYSSVSLKRKVSGCLLTLSSMPLASNTIWTSYSKRHTSAPVEAGKNLPSMENQAILLRLPQDRCSLVLRQGNFDACPFSPLPLGEG